MCNAELTEDLACIHNVYYLNWPYYVVTSVEEWLNQVIFALTLCPIKPIMCFMTLAWDKTLEQ
jgi:hypothetical protein